MGAEWVHYISLSAYPLIISLHGNSIVASHNEKLDLWQQRVGIDDSTPAVSRVRSAHKISTTSAGTSKVAEPRGFLTLLSSSWGGGGADVDDEIEETTDGFGMFGYVANIRKSVPIYDTNYYLVFEREAGQDTASDFG